MRIFEISFSFIKSKSLFISNLLQSIRTNRLIKTRKFQIRKVFINLCLRNRFVSNFYFHAKSRQKNRSFRHTKCFSSQKTYFTRLSHQFRLFFILSIETCTNQTANESNFNQSINQCMIRKRDSHLLNNILIVIFRISHWWFWSKKSILTHVVVVFELFVSTTICMSIFAAFIWNIVIVVSSNKFLINVWINFEKRFRQYFSHWTQFTEIFESMNWKLDEFFASLCVLLIDFSTMNFTFSFRQITWLRKRNLFFCEHLLWILHATHAKRKIKIEFCE